MAPAGKQLRPLGDRAAPRRAAGRRAAGRRAGMTLAELSVSLGIIATLMVATGSIMTITGRAVAMSVTHAAEARIDDIGASIASEYRLALTILEHTPTSITFTVADRDGDGVPETIRYAWSGVAGDPLTRQVNGGVPVVIATDVKRFNLSYLTKTSAPPAPVPQVETTTDEVIYAHEGGSGVNYAISATAWGGQYFLPKLGRADATSFRVTQVQVMASRPSGSTTGKQWFVRLYPANTNGTPNTLLGPIEEKVLPMSSLTTSVQWSPSVEFTKLDQNLEPSKGYCIVIGQTVLTTTGSLSFNGASSDPNGAWVVSSTGGATWTASGSRDLRIRILGRYKYPAP